jgi:hypothetical protein
LPTPPIPITVDAGNLRLIDGGYIRFDRQRGAVIKIGALTLRVNVAPFSSEDVTFNVTSDINSLTVNYNFTGNIPNSPFSYLNFAQNEIGFTQGIKVYINFNISRVQQTLEIIQFDFSIYAEIDPSGNFVRVNPLTPPTGGVR